MCVCVRSSSTLTSADRLVGVGGVATHSGAPVPGTQALDLEFRRTWPTSNNSIVEHKRKGGSEGEDLEGGR